MNKDCYNMMKEVKKRSKKYIKSKTLENLLILENLEENLKRVRKRKEFRWEDKNGSSSKGTKTVKNAKNKKTKQSKGKHSKAPKGEFVKGAAPWENILTDTPKQKKRKTRNKKG